VTYICRTKRLTRVNGKNSMQFDKIIFKSTYLRLFKAPVRPVAKYYSKRGTWDERGKE
jgi:hypothetical protein